MVDAAAGVLVPRCQIFFPAELGRARVECVLQAGRQGQADYDVGTEGVVSETMRLPKAEIIDHRDLGVLDTVGDELGSSAISCESQSVVQYLKKACDRDFTQKYSRRMKNSNICLAQNGMSLHVKLVMTASACH